MALKTERERDLCDDGLLPTQHWKVKADYTVLPSKLTVWHKAARLDIITRLGEARFLWDRLIPRSPRIALVELDYCCQGLVVYCICPSSQQNVLVIEKAVRYETYDSDGDILLHQVFFRDATNDSSRWLLNTALYLRFIVHDMCMVMKIQRV